MPTKGKFSVELINAATKEAFLEFDAKGKGKRGVDAYVEVEPNAEYFLRMKNNYSRFKVELSFKVDGVDLNYTHSLNPGETHDCGLYSYDEAEATSTHTSLKFDKIFRQREQQQCSNPDPEEDNEKQYTWFSSDIGTVEVTFYREISSKGSYKMNTTKPISFVENPQNEDDQLNNSRKRVKSNSGKKLKSSHDDGMRDKSKRGRKLETIKVRYCSTVGLIENGVLPEPPNWEAYCKLFLKENGIEPRPEIRIKPTPWKQYIRDKNGNVVSSVETDCFDLTTLEDETGKGESENTSNQTSQLIKQENSESELQPEIQIQPSPLKREICDNHGKIVKSVESDCFDLTTSGNNGKIVKSEESDFFDLTTTGDEKKNDIIADQDDAIIILVFK